jgi:hypothetical protein
VRVTSAPVVTLGGNPASVLFAGLTPESVGLHVRSFCRAIRKNGARRLPPSRRRQIDGMEGIGSPSWTRFELSQDERGRLEPLELLSEQRHPHNTDTPIQTGRPVWTTRLPTCQSRRADPPGTGQGILYVKVIVACPYVMKHGLISRRRTLFGLESPAKFAQ